MGARSAEGQLTRRFLRDGRGRTIGFAVLFGLVSYTQPVAYLHSYRTLGSRLAFAHAFANNKAVVVFYGKAYDLLTAGGYTAWRVGGTLAIFASVFGLLAGVRALRTEEDSGRTELLLAAPLARRRVFVAALTACLVSVFILWAAELIGLVAGGLAAGASAYLSLSTVSVAFACLGVGALVSQLASSRRLALELGGGTIALLFLLRVVADSSDPLGFLRWLTPLGWAEELRPFTSARPLWLLAPLLAGIGLMLLSARLAGRRDIGSGIIAGRDVRSPRLGLLSSPAGLALRSQHGTLIAWAAGLGSFALVVGIISKSVNSKVIPQSVNHAVAQLGAGSILTPRGYIGFSFVSFVLMVAIFAVTQIVAAAREEGGGQLETMLAQPLSRRGWFGGRMLVAVIAAAGLSLLTAMFAWLGAITQSVPLSLAVMLEAGFNCLAMGILFLGIGAAAYGLVPRACALISYGLVVASFLWQLLGSVLGVPTWLRDATPFAHLGLAPAHSARPVVCVVLIGVGLVAAALGVLCLERRDLTSFG